MTAASEGVCGAAIGPSLGFDVPLAQAPRLYMGQTRCTLTVLRRIRHENLYGYCSRLAYSDLGLLPLSFLPTRAAALAAKAAAAAP